MSLSPTDKLKQKIIAIVIEESMTFPIPTTAEDVGAAWDKLDDGNGDGDDRYEVQNELRSGGYATGLPCDSSRHYSSKSVAAKMLDGSWVGWTYWFGGGKHGEPESFGNWMGEAYDVEMTEVVEVVRKFKKVESTKGG